MRDVTIARNYAETLVALAGEHDALEKWGGRLDVTAAAMSTAQVEAVLMSPRVDRDRKIALMTDALQDYPRPFSLFIAAVIRRGRQQLLGQIADEYHHLVDTRMNRVRAGVTVARDVDALARQVIVERLSKAIGKNVIAGFTVDPELFGGVVVRIGDRIYDGSVRKRLGVLRHKLLTA
ncbi:MAG TPA: ATP synthase F1 subunit delta [Gemmatimonadales bacterium]